MNFLKPLFKTLLVSGLLFFALVYLGMKYHWIGFNQQDSDKDLELKIPKNTVVLSSEAIDNSLIDDDESVFQPQIIQTSHDSSLVINMTKSQVITSCTQLLSKKILDASILELAVGDCVISNYQDPIIEARVEEGKKRSTANRQIQFRKNNALKACNQSVRPENYSNEIEKQLLLGICVSRK